MNNFQQKGELTQVPKITANVPSLNLSQAKPKPVVKPNPSKTFSMPVGGIDQTTLAMGKALNNKLA